MMVGKGRVWNVSLPNVHCLSVFVSGIRVVWGYPCGNVIDFRGIGLTKHKCITNLKRGVLLYKENVIHLDCLGVPM